MPNFACLKNDIEIHRIAHANVKSKFYGFVLTHMDLSISGDLEANVKL